MISETIVVINKTGLHARPANFFVKEAVRQPCKITFKKDGKEFNGKSIVNVLSANVRCGSEIELIADGDGEQQALEKMAAAVKSGLGE
jgi:phosphocarrier protein